LQTFDEFDNGSCEKCGATSASMSWCESSSDFEHKACGKEFMRWVCDKCGYVTRTHTRDYKPDKKY